MLKRLGRIVNVFICIRNIYTVALNDKFLFTPIAAALTHASQRNVDLPAHTQRVQRGDRQRILAYLVGGVFTT